MNKTKLVVVAFFTIAILSFFALDLGQYFTLEFVQSRLSSIQDYKDENFAQSALIYFLIYTVAMAAALPVALILSLLGGAVFGVLWGALLISFASTIGATLAFLASRLILRSWVHRRYGDYLESVNRGIEKDGNFYLFSLRMIPLFPPAMINLLMGLTSISTVSFYFVSQAGMLTSTVIYANAGSELAQISSLSGLVSAPVIFSLVLLGIFPLFAKLVLNSIQRNKVMKAYTKPKSFDANVVVVGAGSAGLVASLITAGAKAKVILVERDKMGGDCLNTGCVPSKSIIRSARIMSYIKRAKEYGIDDATGNVNFPAVMARVQNVIKTIEPHDSVERFTSLGVEVELGDAIIESPYTVVVNNRRITTRSIILATGARPLVPPIPGLDSIDYLSSDSIWSLKELPKRLLVVGGGPIGCELAQAFSHLGSEVVQVDMADRIMPREDKEVSDIVMDAFAKQGIKLLTEHKLLKFGSDESGDYMEADHQGETVRVEFDKVLLAIGRKANVEGIGLEELGLALTPQGTVRVNEYLQTSIPNIYACGDVAGPYQFTHMASFQAWFASLNAMFGGLWRSKVNYNVVPWATFTDPEVARVGLSEQDLKEQNIAYEVTRYQLDHHDRSLTDGEAHGFIKVLTQPGKDKILGVTIVGYHAGEIITEFVFAMTHGMGLKKISAVTHIYPTLGEANKFAANAWRSERLPQKYFPWLERFFAWYRS